MRERITKVLKAINLYSDDARELIMGTFAQESRFRYTKQIGGGPALGFCQMEPDTFNDIVINYLNYKQELKERIIKVTKSLCAADLENNIELMVAMTRVHYLRVPEKLPDHNDIEAMGRYWKKYYNTHLGKGKVEEFVANYKRYCL